MSLDEAVDCTLSLAGQGEQTKATLSLRWLRDAVGTPLPESPEYIAGMMRAGELCVLGAERGIGKSWFAKNAAVLLGQGDGYLGGTLRVLRPAKVLVCHDEIDAWEASRRWKMLTGTGEVPEGVAETFDRWRLRTVRKRSSAGGSDDGSRWSESDEWIDASLDGRLEQTIAAHGFEVVIIDPWAVYFSGSENSNDEVEAALDKLRDLALRYGVAILILHHLGKAIEAREPEDLWRGASRLADWASTRITLLRHYSERQAEQQGMTRQQARRYVDVKFLRRSTPTDDFSMKLNAETGWWERWIAPEQAADARRVHLGADVTWWTPVGHQAACGARTCTPRTNWVSPRRQPGGCSATLSAKEPLRRPSAPVGRRSTGCPAIVSMTARTNDERRPFTTAQGASAGALHRTRDP